MLRSRILSLSIFLFVSALQLFSQRTTPVIRQVDHILVESPDPKAFFPFFADTLQLPVAWPLAENREYVTGGIGTGNLNLELFSYPNRRIRTANFYGIAFEPYPLADALRRLQSLKIPFSSPVPTVSDLPNGTRGTAWTTVDLPVLSKPGMSLFLYEYSPAFLKVDVRRKQLGNRLKLNNGGPLGIEKVSEIAISTTRLKEDMELWSKLLGQSTLSGKWNSGGGVAIRLFEGKANGIQEITFKIESLQRAIPFLQKNRLAGSIKKNGICLSPLKMQGLDILLTDRQ